MKKLYLITFLTFSCSIFAQNYIPITQTDNQWKVKYSVPIMVPEPCQNINISHLYALGQTVEMNGNTYRELWKKYDEGALESFSIIQTNCPEEAFLHTDLEGVTTLENTLIGFIRDDEPNKKIYYLENGSSSEVELYNFNYPLGNTIEDGYLIQMSETTAYQLSTTEKKISYQTEFIDMSYIGIGSAGDLIKGHYYLAGLEYGGFNLEGFSTDGGQTFYNRENQMTVIDLIQNPELSIYPNPVKDFLHIKSHQKISNIDIFDLSGKRVSSDKNSTKISVKHLTKGNYVLVLKFENGKIQSKKFVKQ